MAATGGAKAALGTYSTRIVRKLTDALAPVRLVLTDESARHAGHAGNPGGGETHFHVEIVSEQFRGVRMLERQRRVYAILAEELRERVHALSMRTRTPSEDGGGGG
jgi:BolA family transcriptional regulator, general stress-responsive regulator